MHGTAWGSTAGEIRLRPSRFSFSPCCAVLFVVAYFVIFIHCGNPEAFPYTNYYTNIGTTTKKEIPHINIITYARVVLYTPRRYLTYATRHSTHNTATRKTELNQKH